MYGFTKLLTRPKPKLWDFKILASLCIHRVIDAGSLDSMIRLLHWPNPKVTFSRTMGDAMIDRARSQEASMFYRDTDSDVLLFIDDDITYSPETAIKLCREAYERKSIVGGAYVIKKENYTWITSKPMDDQPIDFKPNAELVEARWVAGGFMAIHRSVLTAMIEELKLPLCHPKDMKFWPFFLPILWQHPNGDWLELSEDWAFCEKARQLGFKVWIDPSVRIGHAGRYNYDLNDLCREPKEYCENIRYTDQGNAPETTKEIGEKVEVRV